MALQFLVRLVLALAAVLSVACNGQLERETAVAEQPLAGSGISAEIAFDSDWTSGYVATVTVSNTGTTATSSWNIILEMNDSTLDGTPWNASYTTSGTQVSFSPASYNAVIAAGSTTTFGLKGLATGNNYHPTVVAVTRDGAIADTQGSNGSGGNASTNSTTASGGTTTSSTTKGSSVELSIEIPAGVSLHQVALGATRSLVVADAVVIDQPAAGEPFSITSTGTEETNLGANALVKANVWSVGTVNLRSNGRVEGDVTTTATLEHQSDVPDVTGTVSEHATLTPVRRYAWQVAFPDATESFDLVNGQARDLPPGSYGYVTVNQNSTLRLTAGTYFFRQLTMQSGSILETNATDSPVLVYVSEGFTHRGRVEGTGTDRLLVGYVGTNTADIDGPFSGTIVAPNAYLRLSPVDGSGRSGSFFGQQIFSDARNPLTFVSFKHWDWIFPPRLTLDCASRAAWKYGAGVFSYDNPLDFEVTIPEGPRNDITEASRNGKGPLEVFEPGIHSKAFILPFRGDTMTWTLQGNETTIDSSAVGCTLSDYVLRRVNRPSLELQGVESPVSAALALERPSFEVPDDSAALYPIEVPESSPSGVNVLFTGLAIGDECQVGSMDVDLAVKAYGGTDHEQSETRDVYNQDWEWQETYAALLVFAPGYVIATMFDEFTNLDEGYNFTTYPEDGDLDLHIDVWERDSGGSCDDWYDKYKPCGCDDHEVSLSAQFDPTTYGLIGASWTVGADDSTWTQNLPTAGLIPTGGDANSPQYCLVSSDNWGVCFQVLPGSKPKLCASWPAQYVDSGRGEDILNTSAFQQVPASFAQVRLEVTGGTEPYETWPAGAYAVLDKNGCLPDGLVPTRRQLESASVNLQWLGRMSLPVGPSGEELVVQLDRTFMADDPSNGDPWAACECDGATPFKDDCRSSGQICDIYTQATYAASWVLPPPAYVPVVMNHSPVEAITPKATTINFNLGSPDGAPTVYSDAAGIVSALLLKHSEGTDMGLVAGKIQIWPESLFAFEKTSLFVAPSAGPEGQFYLHARPSWYLDNGAEQAPDSARKFAMVHELGHNEQRMAAGEVGNGSYVFQPRDSNYDDCIAENCSTCVDYECDECHETCAQSTIVTSVADPDWFPPECRCGQVGATFSPQHCMNSLEVVGGASGEGFAHFLANRMWNVPTESDCTMNYAKNVLVPPAADGSCPLVGGLDNSTAACHPVSVWLDDPTSDLSLLTDSDIQHLREDLSDWYVVDGPVSIPCADAWKWRNNYCADSATTEIAGYESDMRVLGVESDWMQFFWNLTVGPNPWTIAQFFALQRAACGDVNAPCTDTNEVTNPLVERAWTIYAQYILGPSDPAGLPRPAIDGLTDETWEALGNYGNAYGVSTVLAPAEQ